MMSRTSLQSTFAIFKKTKEKVLYSQHVSNTNAWLQCPRKWSHKCVNKHRISFNTQSSHHTFQLQHGMGSSMLVLIPSPFSLGPSSILDSLAKYFHADNNLKHPIPSPDVQTCLLSFENQTPGPKRSRDVKKKNNPRLLSTLSLSAASEQSHFKAWR